MIGAIAQRNYLALPLAAGCMAVFGLAITVMPVLAGGMVVLAAVTAFVLAAPLATLLLIVFTTALVPYELQNELSGGAGSPGLLPSDLLLILGIGAVTFTLFHRRLDRRRLVYAIAIAAFIVVCIVQFAHGLSSGHNMSEAGGEFRQLLGFGAFLLAVPLLDDIRARPRLLKGMLVIAIALGAWGLLQWVLQLSFTAAGDVGVRQGVAFTTTGRGQIQGGLYGFPVGVIACYGALLSGGVRAMLGRTALAAAILLNAVSCLLTFERTFWVATAAGVAFVTVKATGINRIKALLAGPLILVAALAVLSTFAPNELTTARERLLTLGQYETDESLRYRIVESRHVVEKIRDHPIVGSGLAAEIYWGRPWQQVPPSQFSYTHNGYLWLAWKLGIPTALLLVLLIGYATLVRGRPIGGPLMLGLRNGAQGSLFALLLVAVTFPSFRTLGITAVMGVLLALAVSPVARRGSEGAV